MKMTVLDYEKRPYIVFAIIFGILFILLIFAQYTIKGFIDFDIGYLMPIIMYLIIIIIFRIPKVSYDQNQIKYRGFFGTKTINIKDIKRFKIKSEVHTISTKPIFGLFKITVNNPMKPMFGLVIDTIKEESEIIIPVNLFTADSVNKLMEHINNVNGEAKGKANAGKSIFKY